MLFIGLYNTPMNMAIYRAYERCGMRPRTRVIVDQLLLCWFTNSLQMCVMHILTGRPLANIWSRVFSYELVNIVKASWIVWIPAKVIMFFAVPAQFRILFQSLVAFVWQIYLSLRYNVRSNDDSAHVSREEL